MDPQPQEMAREIIMLLGHHQCGRKNAFNSLKKKKKNNNECFSQLVNYRKRL